MNATFLACRSTRLVHEVRSFSVFFLSLSVFRVARLFGGGGGGHGGILVMPPAATDRKNEHLRLAARARHLQGELLE